MSARNDSPSSSHALVPVAPETGHSHHSRIARPAAFLAHLIATARHLPQTRERCRAEPADVIATYRAAIAKLQELNAVKPAQ